MYNLRYYFRTDTKFNHALNLQLHSFQKASELLQLSMKIKPKKPRKLSQESDLSNCINYSNTKTYVSTFLKEGFPIWEMLLNGSVKGKLSDYCIALWCKTLRWPQIFTQLVNKLSVGPFKKKIFKATEVIMKIKFWKVIV